MWFREVSSSLQNCSGPIALCKLSCHPLSWERMLEVSGEPPQGNSYKENAKSCKSSAKTSVNTGLTVQTE